ncbi:dirigent protein 1 [Nicotiana attenuata]|uniref:Dirigent protein n=1 Tax=Nicotiana attenuata TaxID=49451 RepID=A0A1J6I457_NICAT|nr:dirigent protein 1 [Nicotiana attenuata]
MLWNLYLLLLFQRSCIWHSDAIMVAVDGPVTEGPDPKSKEIGRAQDMYINSQLDDKGLHLMFSVIFTDGEFKGSTLEIQASSFSLPPSGCEWRRDMRWTRKKNSVNLREER